MSATDRPWPDPIDPVSTRTVQDRPGTSLVGAEFSRNVRVKQSAPTLSVMLTLQQAASDIVVVAYAYRETGDPLMRESMKAELYRIHGAVQALLVEVETQSETDSTEQMESGHA